MLLLASKVSLDDYLKLKMYTKLLSDAEKMVVLLLKRVLPQFIRDATEGAGFNIAYFVFFLCTSITLWNP